jgi:hypothetical protein
MILGYAQAIAHVSYLVQAPRYSCSRCAPPSRALAISQPTVSWTAAQHQPHPLFSFSSSLPSRAVCGVVANDLRLADVHPSFFSAVTLGVARVADDPCEVYQ